MFFGLENESQKFAHKFVHNIATLFLSFFCDTILFFGVRSVCFKQSFIFNAVA